MTLPVSIVGISITVHEVAPPGKHVINLRQTKGEVMLVRVVVILYSSENYN